MAGPSNAESRSAGAGGLRGRVDAARAGRHLSEQRREEIARRLYFEDERRPPYLWRFTVLSVLSVLIATYGVIADSGPVVIGAMLIAPLMTPLLGLAAALVTGQPDRQLETALIVVLGAVGMVVVAFLASASLPNREVLIEQSSELLSRTSPGIVDLLIGLAAGAAGAYVIVHREALSALPGAAIAVALIPPLAVVGISLELGRSDLAEGAALLFVTNLAAIVLSAAIVFVATGVVARRPEGGFSHHTRVGLISALVAVAAVAYPLGKLTDQAVEEANDQSAVREEAQEWVGGLELNVIAVEVDGDDVRVDIVGAERPPPVIFLERSLDERLGRELNVTVPWVKSEVLGGPLADELAFPQPGTAP